MLDYDSLRQRIIDSHGRAFPLLFWDGAGRVVAAGERAFALQVRGKRADFTWDRLRVTWERLERNHVLTADELGGGHDGVGLVSLLVAVDGDEFLVDRTDGLLRLRETEGVPVRQFQREQLPTSWSPWKRKLAGD